MSTRKSKRVRGDRPPLPLPSTNIVSQTPSAPASASLSTSASSPVLNPGSSYSQTQIKTRSWKAKIWKHYDTHNESEYDDRVTRAFCKYCGGGPILAPSGKGTSNFKRHFLGCSKRPSDIEDELIERGEGNWMHKVDQSFYKELVCLSIIRHNLPLSIAEHKGTRDVHTYLNASCKPFCRNTAMNYVLKIHKRESDKLKEIMSTISGRICLTSDMWTSVVDQGFNSFTAHYIDDDWKLHCKLINFHHVEPPHTALALHDTLFSLLRDWGIHKKVFTITLDNARSNDNMQSKLLDSLSLHSSLPCGGKFFHVRCSAHILNLVVVEGLKVVDVGVKKVKKMVLFVGSSERRTLEFKEIALSLGLDCSRNLRLDCPTRWNSTYTMLDRALAYRSAFSSGRIMRIDSDFPPIPSNEEWDRIEKICHLLKPFDELTTLMSGRLYPTSNLYFKCVWKIELLLLKYGSSEDNVLVNMADMMKKKFDKYWSSFSMILSFAIMLDPRYKFKIIRHCFEKLDVESAPSKSLHVKEEFQKLFQEYDTRTNETSRNQAMDHDGDFEGCATLYDHSRRKSEFDVYFEETLECHNNLDVLAWWKTNAYKFPSLARMAKDVLAIPITTVASESAFSMGSRVITKWRSSLRKETAEALLTTRSWLYGLDIEEDSEDNLEEGLEIHLSRLQVHNDNEEEDDSDMED